MFTSKVRLLIFLIIIFLCTEGFSQANIINSKDGLEVNDGKKICYVITLQNSSNHSIYESYIKTKIELSFRRFGINPIEVYGADQAPDGFLHIMVTIYNNGFNVFLTYRRSVFFMIDDNFYMCRADTWSDGSSGTFSGNQDFINSTVRKYVEQFINDFLKANS